MKKILVMLALMAVFSTTGFSAYTLSSVNIYNVSSAAPLYGHNMVICEAVLAGTSGASITVNIGLQYQNGTTGNWIYLNTSNTAINVSSTSGNPQSTKGTANFNKTFDVYTLVPGTGNQFRCNGTDGTNNKASSTSSMTILTPVLTVTDLSISPVNASSQDIDQNGLFNVTATVRCDNAGNASFPGSCGDVNATLYYNSTASYPNANVTMVGGPTFFTQNPDRPYQWFVGTGATKESILFGFDNNLNDTKSYADPTATGCAQCRFNYSFNSSLTSTTLVYTWTRGSAGPNYLQIYNYTSNSWQTISTSPITMTTESKTVSIANGFMSSAGTVKVSFGAGAGLTLNIYDVYLVNNNPNLGLANPSGYFSLPWGSDFTTTWQVNATRSTGNYWFNVTFNAGYLAQNNTGNFQINTPGAVADTTAPNIGSWAFNVSNMTNYSSTQGYNFNATVTDTTGISYVWLEQNFTGTLTNTTASSCGGNTYCYNVSSLAAGFYQIKWYANDSSSNHNLNNTDWVHYYQVNKSYLPLTLRINGTDGDKVLYNNSNANFTANFSSSYGFNITLYTNLTGSWAVWDNKASPLMNYTILNPYMARAYLIIANFSNQNYTYSQANHTLDLRNYGWLNISYQSPASDSGQNVTANTTFSVTVNVTCVGGDCGNVTGVLRYSTGLNPNTNVSTIVGATPFYTRASYLETIIHDVTDDVWSVAIGDADNDGSNEVVIGMSSVNATNEVRMYENKTGTWVETNISDEPGTVLSVAIGDANNDGKNDVVIGMSTSINELRMYENKTGGWVETVIKNVGANVFSVAIGDADNDSSNEVVIGTDNGVNDVRMYKNVSGGWVETAIHNVPDMVYSVAVGDANNNGRNEVVIGTWTTNQVRMYENKSGAWVETNISDEPSVVYFVAIGDADNDGLNETVDGIGSGINKEVRMHENKTGTWVETNISDEPDNVYTVAIGDTNNDGKNDVAIGIYATNPAITLNELRMYENKSGAWVETNISDEQADVWSVAIGDADNDGSNEVVIGMSSIANEVRMYDIISNPSSCGSLTSGQTCMVSWTVNATGAVGTQYWLDVNFTSNDANVPANDSGNFQINITAAGVQYGWLNISYQSPASGGSQNVYQNGTFNVTVNVTCVGGTCGNVTGVLRYNASAGLNPDTNISLTAGATPLFIPIVKKTNMYNNAIRIDSVAIGDPDNDGLPEFVSSGAPSCTKACSNRITVYSITGSIYGDDTVDSDLSSGEFYSVVVGDADNNGKKEIVVGTSAGSNQVRMYVNETGQWIKYGIDTAVGDTVYSVAIGDADNDGYNEVVAGAGSSAKNETRMYKNVSSTWNEANISEVGKIVWSVAIGDADNDGQNEVVIGTDSGTNEVRMYNYSGGAWAETNIKDTPNSVYSVAIGDADNDGQNEVVIGMESTGVTNKVRMYKNVSGGWMETNISDGPDYGVYSVAIGDANNDGKNEVAIGIYTTVYEVRAYENVSGTWVETNISDGDGSIYGVAVGDVNGYGLNSVVVGGESPTSVSVLDIQSNPMSCGGMSAGQKCYLKWTVNATGPQDTQYWLDVNFTSDKVQVSANDSGDFQLLIVLPSVAGTLNATALMGNISVLKNRLFQVGTRVTCLGGGGAKCYDIDISLWHNMSYQYANTYLSETPGDTPFFVAGTYSESSRDDTYTILRMHMDNIGQDSGTMVYDETNRNNGTKLGDGSPAWSDGMFGSGLSFDGYNDYLNVSTVSSLNTYTKNLTIEFWFRPNKSTFANGDTILARNWDDTGNNSIWIFFWNNPGPKLHFQTITGGTVNDLEGTNSAWVPGKWYFIAATFNGSEADLYINATYDNSYNYVGGNIDKSDNILLIGAKNQWGGRINGTIDELVIFNRTKNNTEIGYDYNYNEHVYSSLMGNQYYKVVWTINATGNVLTDWLFESYVYSSNTSLADTDTNITVSIAPITGCGNYVNCAYPNCASYRDTTTTVQTTDARQKVWSTIRTCWS